MTRRNNNRHHVHYQRLELLHSLNHILYASFVLSYLLSPSHLLTLIIRLTSQVQFSQPRRVHPSRSLRFFLAAWFFINLGSLTVHGIDGSQGTKGGRWNGRGIMLDFVGQSNTPSTLHLILLDLVITALQLVLLLVAFGESSPVPSSTPSAASSSTVPVIGSAPDESSSSTSRRGSALLGDFDADDDNEDSEFDEGGEDEWVDEAGDDVLGRAKSRTSSDASDAEYSFSKRLADTTLSSTSSHRIPDYKRPILNIRLRAIWNELAQRPPPPSNEDDEVRRLEEGQIRRRRRVPVETEGTPLL